MAEEQVLALLKVTEEFKLRVLYASALLFQASITRMKGDAQLAVRQATEGLRTYEAIGQKILLNWFHAMLAEAQADAGNLDAAIVSADQSVTENYLSPVYEPEVLRIRGSILARKAKTLSGAEAARMMAASKTALGEAIAGAHRIGAGLFESAARADLARLG